MMKKMAKELLCMEMVINIKVSLEMVNFMVKAFIIMQMEIK